MAKQGLLITFEGIHGAGKSTLIIKIIEKLSEQGHQTIYLPDQSGTPVGKELRRINLDFENLPVLTESLIVGASRHQSIQEVIKPNIKKGNFIICERFTDAFMAYAFARGMSMDLAQIINTAIADGIHPNLTFLLDLDPAVAIERIPLKERHRFERENLEFHSRLREGYLQLALQHPERIKVIDGSESSDDIFRNIWIKVIDVVRKWEQQTNI
jgi:dTMP kinase